MADFNIPIIEPTIDYTKVPPINQKRTITFINHFIVHTVTFLNKFTLTCEEKLFDFENKLQRVQASLEILESRLSSVPGLENKPQTQETNPQETEKTTPEEIDAPDNVAVIEESGEKETELETQTLSSDPIYQKYFKLLHIGASKEQIKLKMEQEGLDSSVLDYTQQSLPKAKSGTSDTDENN